MAAGDVDEVGRDEVAYSSREGGEEAVRFFPGGGLCKRRGCRHDQRAGPTFGNGDPCHVGVQVRIFQEVGIVNCKFM